MNSTIDASLAPLVGALAFVIAIALYVWMSLALAAMFRKMGEESWKGWVPFLNQATVLAWGGFNPWLVLLVLVPGIGALVVTVLLVISAHRINPGFGYGSGMTVLAALLFVVWASILGFGPAPWRGARHSVAPPMPPRPPLPATSAAFAASAAPMAPQSGPGLPPPAFPPLPPAFTATPAAFSAASGDERAAGAPVAPQPGAPASWAPPTPPTPSVPSPAEPDVESWPSEIDDVSAVSPSPFPPSAAAPTAARPVFAPTGDSFGAPEDEASGGSDGAAASADAEPSRGREPQGDAVISFVPGRRSDGPPPAVVTRLPATAPIDTAPPPAPASPPRATTSEESADADVFPELSGEVSAVVGSPVAGAPLSALSSVSAQQRTQFSDLDGDLDPDAEGDADVDETVMVRRKKVTWQLVPASGSAIALTSDVVLLGRRPAPDGAFPRAQLVAVPDEARTVSKTHARLELRGERWLVTDLGSTNGVLLRTLMGEEIEIEPGTEIDAGERFFLGDEEFHLQHD